MEPKDDFASLLAALGRTPQVASLAQQPVPQQPMMWTPQYFQPVPTQPVATSNSMYIWIIAILLLALVGLGVMYWITNSKMKEEVVEDSEEEDVKPAVFPVLKEPEQEEEEDLTIVQNLLNYARGEHYDFTEHEIEEKEEKSSYIDLSGLELPIEERYSGGSRKIVADESQEVLEYAKKRESLFDNN